MKKFFLVIGGALLAFFALLVVLSMRAPKSAAPINTHKMRVTASVYSIGEFARAVGGDMVDVTVITPSGVEPHEYEPTAQELITIEQSDLFLFNGRKLDPWAEKIWEQRVLSAKSGTEVARMTDAITQPTKVSSDDPHIWLDPITAITEVETIRDLFSRADEKNAAIYIRNADAETAKLRELDREYRAAFTQCASNTVITNHDAFAYLAARYGFDTIAISGISPEEEPSGQHLVNLANLVKKHNIRVVFFETLSSPKFAQTIANETGAEARVLNPIEGINEADQQAGKNYFSLMRDNLEHLTFARSCK